MSKPPTPASAEVSDSPGLGGSLARLGGASIVSTAAQLIRAKLAALFLSPVGVGAFNQFGLLWNLICLAGSLGISNGIIYHAARYRAGGDTEAMKRLVSTAYIVTFGATLLLSLAGFVFSTEISALVFGGADDHSLLVRLGFLLAPMGVALALNRAFLSGFKDSSLLARSQVVGDVLGTALFAIAVIVAGLTGSIVAFLANQAIVLIVAWRGMRRHLGESATLRLREVRSSVLRENWGFSASNLLLIGVSNLTLLSVSAAIIAAHGLADNGIFTSAFRITGILLAAITATTLNYVLPSLSETSDHRQLAERVDTTLQFYFLVSTPALAALTLLGPFVIPVLLSSEFLPAAALLALLVPAELARISAETIGITFLARKRLVAYSTSFLAYAALFTILALALVDRFGIFGVCAAYLAGQFTHLLVALVLTRTIFGPTLSRPSLFLGLSSFGLLFAAGLHHIVPVDPLMQGLLFTTFVLAWAASALLNERSRAVLRSLGARAKRNAQ